MPCEHPLGKARADEKLTAFLLSFGRIRKSGKKSVADGSDRGLDHSAFDVGCWAFSVRRFPLPNLSFFLLTSYFPSAFLPKLTAPEQRASAFR